jgi:hypothetical protein
MVVEAVGQEVEGKDHVQLQWVGLPSIPCALVTGFELFLKGLHLDLAFAPWQAAAGMHLENDGTLVLTSSDVVGCRDQAVQLPCAALVR